MKGEKTKPIVIKLGGSLLENVAIRKGFLSLLAREWVIQQQSDNIARPRIILVHGGGKDISSALASAGIEPKFINGLRFTDQKTMAIVEHVLSNINQQIVKYLVDAGAKALGGSGKSTGLMQARPLPDLGLVGIPSVVDNTMLSKVLEAPDLWVFYTVALGAFGESLNVNADDFAQKLAIACGADQLIFMTDSGGIQDENGKLIDTMTPQDVERLIANATIKGGMAVKARACVDALRQGVRKVTIAHNVDNLATASPLRAFGTSFLLTGPVNKNE